MKQPGMGGRARPGLTFMVTLIFISLFACMAVAVASTAQSNMVVARNRVNTEQSLAMAQGGLCLMLKNVGGLNVSGAADASAVRQKIGTQLKAALANSSMLNANNITWDVSGVHVPTAIISRGDGSSGQFDMVLQPSGGAASGTIVTVTCVGRFGGASRSITYHMETQGGQWQLLDGGATVKGDIDISGNTTISGANNAAEGSLLSASTAKNAIKLSGNVGISGDVTVCNTAGAIKASGNVSIGGDRVIGAPEPDWPIVDISSFTPYATQTRTSGASGNITLSNIKIPPNTNPTFSGNTTINGVIYVQSPNRVTFSGNLTITGLIVCDEPAIDDLANNSLSFSGNVTINGVQSLPAGSQYDGLRNQTGSFLLAPGFAVSLSGNSTTINGCLVADQFTFSGNSTARIKGGIVSLGDNKTMRLSGNSGFIIDKSGINMHPAGLKSGAMQLVCVSGSYAE
jgi:hypothetical protein